MNLQLTDRVVFVSGGAAGIGAATVSAFAAEGAHVAFADRNAELGATHEAMLRAAGAKVRFIHGDLSDEQLCKKAVDTVLAEFGRLDVLVNNAGVNDAIGLNRPAADFQASLARNLLPAYQLTHFAATALKQSRGAIVNVSSKVAVTGQANTSGYAAAKGAINALTREWAVDLAPHQVRVNCVVPAECDTPQYQSWFNAQTDPALARAHIAARVPLGRRLTSPEEVAAMILFLASPISSHTTGQIIFVDGGYTHLDRGATQESTKWSA